MSIQYEKASVEKMIRLFCKLNHKRNDLCADCEELKEYAFEKLQKCPLKEKKLSCKKCPIHCYSTDKKEKIREVMRFSGPKMILYHPKDFLKHLLK